MNQPQPTVEIIPWWHDIRFKQHQQVIEAIRKLPKNGTLFLEIREPELIKHRKVTQYPVSNLLLEWMTGGGLGNRVIFDVLNACESRNIQMLPMESVVANKNKPNSWYGLLRHPESLAPRSKLLRRLLPAAKSAKSIYDFLQLTIEREQAFARNIAAHLKGKPHQPIYVLTGSSHTEGLVQELQKRGIPSKVRTGLFVLDHEQENEFNYRNRLLQLFREGKYGQIVREYGEAERKTYEKKHERQVPFTQKYADIQRIRERNKTKKAHLQRRLTERRARVLPK
ncbi:MAG: hypothetical protein HY917_04610 [Candidatus Diapherotrites archaeon]|nr:hypothetical protein [Candidatus Diapherotrites archaeon]